MHKMLDFESRRRGNFLFRSGLDRSGGCCSDTQTV